MIALVNEKWMYLRFGALGGAAETVVLGAGAPQAIFLPGLATLAASFAGGM